MIILKTKHEIEEIKESCCIAADVLSELELRVKPGITTVYLNTLAEKMISRHKAISGFLGYSGYPYTICASVNDVVVHGMLSDEPLLDGDIISIDLGVIYNGWYSDTAITVPVGDVSVTAKKLIKITEECLYKAIDKLIPGERLGTVSNTIQTHVESNGFNVVRNYMGHGIGRSLHEDPKILNCGKKSDGKLIKSGMVVAIEPITTEKNHENIKLADGWTVKTKDGGLAAHFEHTVAVTDNGPEILTERN